MFTLSGLILEDGENLFRDFWSLFSISFICFSMRNYFKKMNRPSRAVPDPDSSPAGLYKPGEPSPEPPSPALTLDAAAPCHRRRRYCPPRAAAVASPPTAAASLEFAAAGGSRRRRRSSPVNCLVFFM